jgi:DNA-directed RNA polymerase III subunit RPC8
MYNLAVLRDTVRILPQDFHRDSYQTIADALNRKYANRIVKDVGLCIALWDVLEKGDEFLFPQDGAAFLKVKFRIIVFRPFVGEVIVGKVVRMSRAGLQGVFS